MDDLSDAKNICIFVRDHLTHINHAAGVIEYLYNGDNMEQGFDLNPLAGIRSAIKQIDSWDHERGDEEGTSN